MIEFGEFENHPSHPGHKLKMVNIERPFKCDGCLELGFGSCYTCTDSSTSCNFHLHKDCARAWTEVPTISHPFFPKLQFHFLAEGRPNRYCDACGRDVKGYAYHCGVTGFDLHPCCANLPRVLSCRDTNVSEDGEEVRLVLKKKVTSKCCNCGKKKLCISGKKKNINTWCYVSENQEVNFHVSCVKEMVCESWQDGNNLQIERRDVNACPKLQIKLYKGSKSRGSGSKFGMLKKVLKLALTFAIAAVIGDPTAMVVALVTSLITH
ncbi:hypothetical protein J5N97_002343 [Dioscorea zingiberensis]|uniref:DC1 domain-containing protein n=1 Tax=Dioscorea zingiberensis TaxID=325984 RepID=A0A9D5HQB2_9LILI|nr:hypothetical protein J5N97_002343 [Dioscorea zingiberensis]